MAEADRGIYFDEDLHIRILDVDKFNKSKQLQDNCQLFVSNIQTLQDIVNKYISAVDGQAEKIESEKLRAIGLRNKVAALSEERKRRDKEQARMIAERQEELERLLLEEQSLLKVKQEQELLIAKLTDSSTGAAYM